jgi:hypothetical protein
MQHIDEPQPHKDWTNPPHRSHECQHCGTVWRPADVPTNGVRRIATKGKRDTAALDSRYAHPSHPTGSATGWKLAMRVLQSDLYQHLDGEERAACDELVKQNPYLAPPKPTAPDGGGL